MEEYLREVVELGPEAARSERFAVLLSRLFSQEPRLLIEYFQGRERGLTIREGARVYRGRADCLSGNLVLEFERSLSGAGKPGEAARGLLAEAQDQLRRYVAALWSEEKPEERRPYVAMATDGVLFAVYTPLAADASADTVQPDDIFLQPLTEDLVDLRKLDPAAAFTWIDRYFLHHERRRPTTEEVVADFGLHSHAFATTVSQLGRLWESVAGSAEFAVLFDSWDNYLRIVYGKSYADEPSGRELFIRHTYLATLAKLMVWVRLQGGKVPEKDDTLLEVLRGEAFEKVGIANFLEEDFFAWPARGELWHAAAPFCRRLLDVLDEYDLSELSEDVFKGLYEQLVDPEDRHDLGEYYTPDWLAAKIVKRVLDGQAPDASVLDPACGSGTFLYHTLQYKRRRLAYGTGAPGGSPAALLEALQRQVVGIDVHPLAVTIAKANYLLALADLLPHRRRPLAVPVYLANSIRKIRDETASQRYPGLPVRRLQPDPRTDIDVFVPTRIGADPTLCDRVIDACRHYAQSRASDDRLSVTSFRKYITTRLSDLELTEPLTRALFDMTCSFAEFIRRRRDTIQAYVLKNMLKPIFLKGQFHVVLGNPPWLAFRYIKAPEYQHEIRELLEEYGLPAGGHLATHMELAALFLLRCADWYLRDRGTIAFVQPRSIFSADQHSRLRKGEFRKPRLSFVEAWDLEGVKPLFNVPAAVLIAEKRPEARVGRTVPGLRVRGQLRRRNAAPEEAAQSLTEEQVTFYLHTPPRRSYWDVGRPGAHTAVSPYGDLFQEGATIVPRPLWFVEKVVSPLGMDESLPYVRTDPDIYDDAKAPWKGVHMEGRIEARFLYPVVLSKDLVPFGIIEPHLAVLPIVPAGTRYRVLSMDEASAEGFLHLGQWLKRVEEHWQRGRAAAQAHTSAPQWLDWHQKLSRQASQAPRLAYPDVVRVLFGAPVASQRGRPLVLDYTNYWAPLSSAQEARYLAASMSARCLDACLGQLRRRRQRGQPHVGKKIWDVAPLPRFDPDSEIHARLAQLGEQCERKVRGWLEQEKRADTEEARRAKIAALRRNIGRTRQRIREYLAEELAEIDELVSKLLGL